MDWRKDIFASFPHDGLFPDLFNKYQFTRYVKSAGMAAFHEDSSKHVVEDCGIQNMFAKVSNPQLTLVIRPDTEVHPSYFC